MSKNRLISYTGLVALLLLMIVISASLGAVKISPGEILDILTGRGRAPYRTILLNIRLPRVIEAVIIGTGLSVSGAFFQGLLHNPMADPYILGVSSGAALGATISLVIGLGLAGTHILAFITALGTVYLVLALSKIGTRISVTTTLLAGIAISSFLSSVISLMMLLNHEELDRIVFWMMGGLGLVSWKEVLISAPVILLGSCILYAFSRDMNAIILGEETAEHLGVDIEKVKRIVLLLGSLITATAVSVSGIIGFVGLIVPHITRLLVGPDNRVLVPFTAVIGSIFLVLADTLSRMVIPPTEIPVGIITAAFGGPFFLYILNRSKSEN